MKRMKKLLVVLLWLGMIHPVHAQNNATLVLWHPDGKTTDVALFTQPRVQFLNDSVLITSTVLDLKFEAKDILRFSYKGDGTGIALPQSETQYQQENGQLVFNGVKPSDHVALYTTNGIRVPVRLSSVNGNASLPLSSVPKGVYVLKVNGKTTKFTRK